MTIIPFPPERIFLLLILLPFIGLLCIAPLRANHTKNISNGILFIQIVCFIFSCFIARIFIENCGGLDGIRMTLMDNSNGHILQDFQFIQRFTWIRTCMFDLHFGIDIFAMIFILLITGAFPCISYAVLKQNRTRMQAVCLLLAEGGLLGCFGSLNLMLSLMFSMLVFLSFYLMTVHNKDDLIINYFKKIFVYLSCLFFIISALGFKFLNFSMEAIFKGLLDRPLNSSLCVFLFFILLLSILCFFTPKISNENTFSTRLFGLLFCSTLIRAFFIIRLLPIAVKNISFFILNILLCVLYISIYCIKKKNFPEFIRAFTLLFVSFSALQRFSLSLVSLLFVFGFVVGNIIRLIIEQLLRSKGGNSLRSLSFISDLCLLMVPGAPGFLGHLLMVQNLQGAFLWEYFALYFIFFTIGGILIIQTNKTQFSSTAAWRFI